MNFILMLFVLILSTSSCSYTASSQTSDWISAESSSSYKWCRYSTTYTSGYSWTYWDESTVWEGDSLYQCSTETSKLPQNSKKLLCPIDTTSCNTRDKDLNFVIILIS